MNRMLRILRRVGLPLVAGVTIVAPAALGITPASAAAPSPDAYLTFAAAGTTAATNVTDAGGSYTNPPVAYSTVDNGSHGATSYLIEGTIHYAGSIAPTVFAVTSSTGNVVFSAADTGPFNPGPYYCPETSSPGTCSFYFADPVSEQTTLSVSDPQDPNVALAATGTANYQSLLWATGCSPDANGQNDLVTNTSTSGGCVTQMATGSQSITDTYLQDGKPVSGVSVLAELLGVDNPPGTPAPTDATLSGPTELGGLAFAITNAAGQATFTLYSNTVGTQATVLSETSALVGPSNTGNYPTAYPSAYLMDNVMTSTVAQRLDNISETLLAPAGYSWTAQPGDVYMVTYRLWGDCSTNVATGQNNCTTPSAGGFSYSSVEPTWLANVPVTLTAPSGWQFTSCSGDTYESCAFTGNGGTGSPSTGSQVGWLKTSGTTMSTTTDSSGSVTVFLTVQSDPNLNNYGWDFGQVTASSGAASGLGETVPGSAPSSDTCGAVGPTPYGPSSETGSTLLTEAHGGQDEQYTNLGDDTYEGCATDQMVQTWTPPLNAQTPVVVPVAAPDSNGTMTTSGTTNLPDASLIAATRTVIPNAEAFKVVVEDQFGNYSDFNGTTTYVGSQDNGGGLWYCTAGQSANSCVDSGGRFSPGALRNVEYSENVNQVLTQAGTVTPAYNDMLDPWGDYTQPFEIATSYNPVQPAVLDGLQGIQAGNLDSSTTTWTGATPASGETFGSVTVTGTAFGINWYNQLVQPIVTFKITNSRIVKVGTVITVSATVKDQYGRPIKGLPVQFFYGGNGFNFNSCEYNNFTEYTDANGTAGASATCSNNATVRNTVLVSDVSGNEIARGVFNLGWDKTPSILATPLLVETGGHARLATIKGSARPGGLIVLFAKTKGGSWHQVSMERANNATGVYSFRRWTSKYTQWKVTEDNLTTSSIVATRVVTKKK